MPRVYVTRPIAPEALAMLRSVAEVQIWDEDRTIPREVLLREVAGVDAILAAVTERVDDELLDAAGPGLRIVANLAVGIDNLDLASLTRRGLVATNTPGVLTETTADFAFALMMSVGRRVPEGIRYVRGGQWQTYVLNLLLGQDIHHTTVGIVGLGRIGLEFARRARGFNMKVLYHNRRPRPADFEREHGVEFRELDDLLAESDYVTIHVDLNDSTRGLFDQARFARMKKTAYLINTARGGIVNTDALYQALRAGTIAGAALDVTDPEPLPADHPLLELDNAIVCPHVGSATVRTRIAMGTLAAENILNVLAGKEPVTPVTSNMVK